jgi:hypothetical protein
MKTAAIALSVGIGLVSGVAFAQTGATDPMTHLRACSLMESAARLECLEKLSRAIALPARPSPADDNWIVSETTSPVDYSPIGGRFTTRNGAIIISTKNSRRADAVLPPN